MQKGNALLCALAVFCLVAAAPIWAEPTWIAVEGSSIPAKPSVEVLNSDEGSTIIEFTVEGFWSEEIVENKDVFQMLSLPGCFSTLDIGKPQLPVITKLIAVPGDAEVGVEVVNYTEQHLTGYRVYPFQRPLIEGEQRTEFDFNEDFYRTHGLYPNTMADIGGPAILRDLRVVRLQLFPIRYNPVTGDLMVYTNLTVRLNYSGKSSTNTLPPEIGPISLASDKMYRQAVLNYEFLNCELEDPNGSSGAQKTDYDFLIIAVDAYVDNMAPFVSWKNSQGITTQIVQLSSVGSTVSQIKSYILQEYTNNNIQYVLLVGDDNNIPLYEGYTYPLGDMISDYYYTLLSGSDNYPDIGIGRFSVVSDTEVDYMVDKSITYESSPPPGDWLDNALLVAHEQGAPGKYQGCKEEIRTAADTPSGTYSVLFPEFTTAYGADTLYGGDRATNDDVIAAINGGQRVVNYRGHGMQTCWIQWNVYMDSFKVSDVPSLDNGEMTPVLFSIACKNNELDWPALCLGEAFTRTDDAAAAFLGASRSSWTYPNHDYDKKLFSAVFDESVNRASDASNLAAIYIIDGWGSYGVDNVRMYLWLGDPTLEVIYGGTPEPHIVATSPIQNQLNVSDAGNISVTFDIAMDLSTFTTSTFSVNASSTGLHQGAFSSGDQLTITFDPTDDFDDGEVVTVVLTSGIESAEGNDLDTSYSWSFTVQTTHASPAEFLYDTSYAVGQFPYAVCAAMFDTDDDPDLAVPNWMTNNVSILLNNGDATFGGATNYATGSTPSFVYSADFDADGNMDLVTSNQNSGELSVLMGNGDGTFDAPVDYAADTITTGVVAADLNGDGIFDLAAPNWAADNVSVLFGNGDGTFGAAMFYDVEDGSNHINGADLDNDADIDLVTTNCSVSSISILFNNGDGTFAAHVDYPVSLCPMGSYAADLNGDGYLDLVTANKNNSTVAVLINNGAGGFATPVSYTVGSYPMHIFASDLDSDGDLDMVAPNVLSDNVSVLLNYGDGTFASHTTYSAGDAPVHVYPSDLDGDGDLDLAVVNEYEYYVSVLLNQPLTSPPAPTLLSPPNGITYYIFGGMRTVTLDWTDVDYALKYEVLLDNDSTFSSPIANPNNLTASTYMTPLLGPGTYYWKVRANNEVGWGQWSNTRYFRIRLSGVSCPVLFSYDGEEFKSENPLLTACENSGYVDIVTDYYHLASPISPRDGRIVFQLRELEDEITYLHDLELITVDHTGGTRVSCDVNGKIDLYQNSSGLLTAVDNHGRDQLAAVAVEDGRLFVASEPGHLVVTFPSLQGDGANLLLYAPRKPPCPKIEEDPDPWSKVLPEDNPEDNISVEVLDGDGNWVNISGQVPSRDDPTQKIVLADFGAGISGDITTLRISWPHAYATDAIDIIKPVNQSPLVSKYRIENYSLNRSNSGIANWNGFKGGQPLVLKRGDVFEFGFAVEATSDPDLVRDHIIRAVGRYHPDYNVYTHLMPREIRLYANFPNPFNPATTISYDLPAASQVRLDIFNVTGQLVTTIVNGWQEAGRHHCVWNSRSSNGKSVASGIYFYRLQTDGFVESRKMVLLK